MKSLTIQSPHYNYLVHAYKEYLQVLGYAVLTAEAWALHVKEFLHYIEQQGIPHITSIQPKDTDDFMHYIKRRSNKKKKGQALSSSHINNIINAVNAFAKFLNNTGKYLLDITAQRELQQVEERTILTVSEIKALYEASFLPYRENSIAMGQRDRAVIAIYYGCGLRRMEGIRLNIADIDLHRKLVFVRKGKGNKQRYVPIANTHAEDIRSYLQEGREWFLYRHGCTYHQTRHGKPYEKKSKADDLAFFVGQYGNRLQSPDDRLECLRKKAGIEKNITLHSLRHSIATHLLQSGMDIEAIARFLGHASLDSTQIYTHIVNEMKLHDDE